MRKKLFVLTLIIIFTLGLAGTALAAPGNYLHDDDYQTDLPSVVLDNGAGIQPETSGKEGLVETDKLINANQSGLYADGSVDTFDQTIKRAQNDDGTLQWVHGDFKKNSNACASCHQTHTAAGQNLLFRNGVYNTCTACHDGTLGKLNVFDPGSDPYDNSGGGSFFYGDGSGNPSMHVPTGFLRLAAAPGGSRDASGDKRDGSNDGRLNHDGETYWTNEFTCVSCHAAHGSYSDRLLHYNPGGRQNEIAVTYTTVEVDPANSKRLIIKDDEGNVVKGPWLYYMKRGSGGNPNKFVESYLFYKDSLTPNYSNTASPMGRFNFNWGQGIFELKEGQSMPDVTNLSFKGVPAMVVVADEAYVGKAFNPDDKVTSAKGVRLDAIRGEDAYITKWSGRDVLKGGITNFCAACHTDYYIDGGEVATETGTGHQGGNYSNAYRHKIHKSVGNVPKGVADYNSGTTYYATCLTCHFAHGTNQNIMLEADDTIARFADANVSSALKRYTNMSVCIKCHVSSHNGDLIQTDTYWNNTDVKAIIESNGGTFVQD